jgi:hypothetical protein
VNVCRRGCSEQVSRWSSSVQKGLKVEIVIGSFHIYKCPTFDEMRSDSSHDTVSGCNDWSSDW